MFLLIPIIALTICFQVVAKDKPKSLNSKTTMNTISLMKKRILLDSSKILYNKPLSQGEFANECTLHHSYWKVKDGWLVGENKGNWPERQF